MTLFHDSRNSCAWDSVAPVISAISALDGTRCSSLEYSLTKNSTDANSSEDMGVGTGATLGGVTTGAPNHRVEAVLGIVCRLLFFPLNPPGTVELGLEGGATDRLGVNNPLKEPEGFDSV